MGSYVQEVLEKGGLNAIKHDSWFAALIRVFNMKIIFQTTR